MFLFFLHSLLPFFFPFTPSILSFLLSSLHLFSSFFFFSLFTWLLFPALFFLLFHLSFVFSPITFPFSPSTPNIFHIRPFLSLPLCPFSFFPLYSLVFPFILLFLPRHHPFTAISFAFHWPQSAPPLSPSFPFGSLLTFYVSFSSFSPNFCFSLVAYRSFSPSS